MSFQAKTCWHRHPALNSLIHWYRYSLYRWYRYSLYRGRNSRNILTLDAHFLQLIVGVIFGATRGLLLSMPVFLLRLWNIKKWEAKTMAAAPVFVYPKQRVEPDR